MYLSTRCVRSFSRRGASNGERENTSSLAPEKVDVTPTTNYNLRNATREGFAPSLSSQPTKFGIAEREF
ncbi:hypothetical protein [Gloeothece citriformis]|uniref:hypothetical protein n=1 Tax=Gloeothece citriformis TaxID=2546356 RepID=UPI0012FEC838|nr:hypothetical protein [Gloeothece citriformis]